MLRIKSVFSRVLLSFLAVIIVFVAAIGLSMFRLSQFNAAVHQVTSVNMPKLKTVNAWTAVTLETEVHTRSLLITDDKAKVSAELAQINALHLQRKQFREQLLASVGSPAEGAMLKQVVAARDVYVPIETQVLALLAKGQTKEARDMLLDRAHPAQASYLDALTALREYYNSVIQTSADQLAAEHARTIVFLRLLTVLAVAVSGAMAVLIARAIRQPLAQAVAVLDAIEQGNLESKIDVSTRDETGRVLRALQNMQRSLKERIETERAAATENARIRTALDRVAVGAMLADNDGKIIYANDFAKSIFRRRAADDSRAVCRSSIRNGSSEAVRPVSSQRRATAQPAVEAHRHAHGGHQARRGDAAHIGEPGAGRGAGSVWGRWCSGRTGRRKWGSRKKCRRWWPRRSKGI